MIDRLGVHRFDHGDLIGNSLHVGNKFAHKDPCLAAPFESKSAWRDRKAFLPAGHGRDSLAVPDRVRQLLVEESPHLRFMIKKIVLGGGPIHVQVNEILCLGSKVGKTGEGRMDIGPSRCFLTEGLV